MAHDNPIPGFGTRNTINLRLWAAKPDKEFDLEAFNTGDYVQVRTDAPHAQYFHLQNYQSVCLTSWRL